MEVEMAREKRFIIQRSNLNTWKLFVEFYLPEYQRLLDKLHRGAYPLKLLGDMSARMFGGPFGSDRKVDMYQDKGIPYIRVKDVLPGGIDRSGLTYISPGKHEEIGRSRVRPGDILITIAGRLGTSAVFPEDLIEGNITGHIAGIELNDSVNPKYVVTVLNSRFGDFQVKRLGHRTTRPELNLQEVSQILIPLPPREVQDHIAGVMQAAYAARREKLAEAERLLSEVDSLVFSKLNLSPERVKEETRFLKPVFSLQGGRFDVAFNMGFHKFDPYPERVARVGEIVSFSKETKNPTNEPDLPFQYIDISSINIVTGEIGEPVEMLGQEAPSRARQVIHAGDILISTVRPTRGAIAIVPPKMDGFICSTGFAIVRPGEKVLTEYLHTALRLNTTSEQFGRRSAGSSYPAILENDIKATLIPLPTKAQQKEIADEIMRRRANAMRLRAEAEQVVAEAKAKVERMILGEET